MPEQTDFEGRKPLRDISSENCSSYQYILQIVYKRSPSNIKINFFNLNKFPTEEWSKSNHESNDKPDLCPCQTFTSQETVGHGSDHQHGDGGEDTTDMSGVSDLEPLWRHSRPCRKYLIHEISCPARKTDKFSPEESKQQSVDLVYPKFGCPWS